MSDLGGVPVNKTGHSKCPVCGKRFRSCWFCGFVMVCDRCDGGLCKQCYEEVDEGC